MTMATGRRPVCPQSGVLVCPRSTHPTPTSHTLTPSPPIPPMQVPALSPRQLRLMAAASLPSDDSSSRSGRGGGATAGHTAGMLQEVPQAYLLKRLGGAQSRCEAV
jgi:hypothetical protein